MSSGSRRTIVGMLLAGDVGGTKTFIGLFGRADGRPRAIDVRTYRTLDFPDLGALSKEFLADAGVAGQRIEAAAFGVAGPVRGPRAALTNVPWVVDVENLSRELPIPRAHLLNDLEALAWSVTVLERDELAVLRGGETDPAGNAALIAAGTGLGVALLANVNGRLVPRASEGGHADFAARNADGQKLHNALSLEYGRTDIERVVSGPGLANIHRILSDHQCAGLTPLPAPAELPAAVSFAALDMGCPACIRTIELFVSAYGAAAGNLALTVLATGGVYLGGGIAPRILPALHWPMFNEAFLAKSPMDSLIARIPVSVILNPQAGLLGAATYANLIG